MLQYIRLIGMMSSAPWLLNDDYAYFRLKVSDDFSTCEYRIIVYGGKAIGRAIMLKKGSFVAVEGRLAWGPHEGELQLVVRAHAFQALSFQAYRCLMEKLPLPKEEGVRHV